VDWVCLVHDVNDWNVPLNVMGGGHCLTNGADITLRAVIVLCGVCVLVIIWGGPIWLQ
jgi:hypothetical protein